MHGWGAAVPWPDVAAALGSGRSAADVARRAAELAAADPAAAATWAGAPPAALPSSPPPNDAGPHRAADVAASFPPWTPTEVDALRWGCAMYGWGAAVPWSDVAAVLGTGRSAADVAQRAAAAAAADPAAAAGWAWARAPARARRQAAVPAGGAAPPPTAAGRRRGGDTPVDAVGRPVATTAATPVTAAACRRRTPWPSGAACRRPAGVSPSVSGRRWPAAGRPSGRTGSPAAASAAARARSGRRRVVGGGGGSPPPRGRRVAGGRSPPRARLPEGIRARGWDAPRAMARGAVEAAAQPG